MKRLLPLVLMLCAPVLGAAQWDAPKPIYWVQKSLAAKVVGADDVRSTRGTETLVFDSFTNATNYTSTGSSPRTFMGMPFNVDATAGGNPTISKITVYLAYTGTAAQTYSSLRVRLQLWDSWSSSNTDPVFVTALGAPIVADVAGPITLNPNTFSPIDVTLASPVALTGLDGHGLVINFQGDTGAGLASADVLTPLLRYGTNGFALGTNGLPSNYGYRNVTGRTDFNFASSDARTFNQGNEGMAFQLYSTGPTLIGQSITGFAATPANPIVSNGSFTVSATGGASGNPVVFTVAAASSTVCTAGGTNGATITILTAGTCTVLANQAGNATYSAAPQQTLAVTIGSGSSSALVLNGGFEDGFATTNWAQTSTAFDTPLCDASCGGVGPRTGTFWAWFGGTPTAEVASLEQTGTIAVGANTLNFYVWWSSSVTAPPDATATFNVSIDGNTVFNLTPASAATYNTGYTLATVDISAYADGNSHTLRFESNNAASASSTNIHLDDIEILAGTVDTIFVDGFEI